MHHHIVALEGIHVPIPTFTIPAPHTADQTIHPLTAPHEVAERIATATIVICSVVKIDAAILDVSVSPCLQLIACLSTGTNHIDLEACRARGIRVCNMPGANIDTVAEHALALALASRRSLSVVKRRVLADDWKKNGTVTRYMRDGEGKPPPTCREEIAGIIGYGSIGKRIAELVSALGMHVIVSDRKPTSGPSNSPFDGPGVISRQPIDLNNPARLPFASVIASSTIIFIVCPLVPSTANLISTPELNRMRASALVINVARGGIVDEAAMASALATHRIAGYASDVFEAEPAGTADSPLLATEMDPDANFLPGAHCAWFSETTMANLKRMAIEVVEGFIRGEPAYVIV